MTEAGRHHLAMPFCQLDGLEPLPQWVLSREHPHVMERSLFSPVCLPTGLSPKTFLSLIFPSFSF